MDALPRSSSTRPVQQLNPVDLFRQPKRPTLLHSKVGLLVGVAVLLVSGLAAGLTVNQVNKVRVQQSTPQPTPTSTQPSPTPQVAAATTFADLLSQKTDYSDWLAGIKDGSIYLAHPQSGHIRQITQAADQWHGPIADLHWSPDRQRLATLVMAVDDAKAMSQNPQRHLRSLGLQDSTSPQSFPFGKLIIIDISSKEVTQTNIELKNTSKPVVWLDSNRLAVMANTPAIYQLSDQQLTSLVAAGSSDQDTQLGSPLAWDSQRQQLYYIKHKQQTNGHISMVSRLNLANSKTEELFVVSNDSESQSVLQQPIDVAISPDNKRLAVVGTQGMSYLDLEDMGMHQLSYSEGRLWMNQVMFSNLSWISDSRLTYQVLYQDGQKAWSGWDITNQATPVFAKGNLFADWSRQSGQLIVGLANPQRLAILTPNWDKPVDSQLTSLELDWTAVSW